MSMSEHQDDKLEKHRKRIEQIIEEHRETFDALA